MKNLKLPFDKIKLQEIIDIYPTPFHIYDEKAIRANIRAFKKEFSWAEGYKNYFAVKALPNPAILKIIASEGFGADCSSLTELMLALRAGMKGDDIMFTSNQTPASEYEYAQKLGSIINLDDITHIDYLGDCCGLPETLSFRYNPGSLKGGNSIIGKPEEAKYGLTSSQMIEAYRIAKSRGVKYFGIHTMVASNELNVDYFVETAEILFNLMVEIHEKTGIIFEFVNLGGGIGIPYRPEQEAVNIAELSSKLKEKYDSILVSKGLCPKLYMECGRVITGPYGYLVTKAIHTKDIYKKYIGVDACAANLMRPSMYGAYHHITVAGKEKLPADFKYDVVGSLCENSDKFAIDRMLPEIIPGDILVIHDTGAHGHSMGYNYNGKLRSAELLLHEDGSVELIRRAETTEDYFATLNI